MSRAYVQTTLKRSPKVVLTSLTEPRTVAALRSVLHRRAKHENGHAGRSGLSEFMVLTALSHIAEKASGASKQNSAEDFLGGNGLVKFYGLKANITAAGSDLLRDAKACGAL